MTPSSARLLPEAEFWTLLFLTLGLLNEDDSWGCSDPSSLPQRISQSCDGGFQNVHINISTLRQSKFIGSTRLWGLIHSGAFAEECEVDLIHSELILRVAH